MASKQHPKITEAELLEIVKCAQDRIYFVDTYCKLVDPVLGLLSFKLFDYQKFVLDCFTRTRYNIILKSRQQGLSNLVAADCLHMAMFHGYKNILVVSIKDTVAKRFLDKIKIMYKKLPDFFHRFIQITNGRAEDQGTTSLMIFSNESRISSETSSKNAGRSEALSYLVLDEAAHIENADNIWAAARPALSTGGRCSILSTVYGIGNFFHSMWVGAVANQNGFNPIRLEWWMYPGRDAEWLEGERKSLGERKWRQEVLGEFESTGAGYFSHTILKGFEQDLLQNPKKILSLTPLRNYIACEFELKKDMLELAGSNRIPVYLNDTLLKAEDLFLWAYPEVGVSYSIGADVAEALTEDHDHQAFYIVRDDTADIVAEYFGKVSINEYATLLDTVSSWFNDATLLIERNSAGLAVIEVLLERNFDPDKFYTQVRHKKKKTDKRLADQDSQVIGFQTNKSSKSIILDMLHLEYEAGTFFINSMRSLCQHQVYVRMGKSIGALPGYSDDLVMAAALTRECLRNKQTTSKFQVGIRG